ncbi:hypothetical protein WAE61_01890 [Comamonadaceae bacterium PP-2]
MSDKEKFKVRESGGCPATAPAMGRKPERLGCQGDLVFNKERYMKIKDFPANVFRLTEAMLIKEVVVAKRQYYDDWYNLDSGASVHGDQLFATQAEAVAQGEALISSQRKKLEKSLANIEKRAKNLAKAACK